MTARWSSLTYEAIMAAVWQQFILFQLNNSNEQVFVCFLLNFVKKYSKIKHNCVHGFRHTCYSSSSGIVTVVPCVQ